MPTLARPTVADLLRRQRAAAIASAARAGGLVVLRVSDHQRAQEVELANEVISLRAELDADAGEPRPTPAELRDLTGREECYDVDGVLSTRPASAEGCADGSRFGRHSDMGTVDLANPLDDDPAPVTGSVDAYLASIDDDDPDDAAERAEHTATFRDWARA